MTRILYFSVIIWILIDRFKPIWQDVKWSGYITNLVALAFGLAVSFCYNLDMLYELQLVDYISLIGKFMTAIALMGGSSCINEIIEGKPGMMIKNIPNRTDYFDDDDEEEEEQE